MADVQDVAAYIIEKQGPMTALKLQKLTYYASAWGLAWENDPLFGDRFEAWKDGPVSRALFRRHKGSYVVAVGAIKGDVQRLSESRRAMIDAVVAHYGPMTPQALSDLTHSEAPWRVTYSQRGHGDDYCDKEIDRDLTRRFYSAQSAHGQGPEAPQMSYLDPDLEAFDAIVDENAERWAGALALLGR